MTWEESEQVFNHREILTFRSRTVNGPSTARWLGFGRKWRKMLFKLREIFTFCKRAVNGPSTAHWNGFGRKWRWKLYIRRTYKRTYYVCTTYIRRTYVVHTTYIQTYLRRTYKRTYDVHTTYIRRTCDVHTTYIRYIYTIYLIQIWKAMPGISNPGMKASAFIHYAS
jgi:hypothetical protein